MKVVDMPRSRSIAAAALAFLVAGCATRPPPPVTIAQANTLPPQQLADIVLRQFAGRIQSVTRPNYDSPFFPDMPLQGLAIATTPTSSYFQGLCEATVVNVGFFERWPSPPPGRNGPVRAQSLSTQIVYKVRSDIELPYGLSLEARERQSQQCASLNPVIAPEQRRLGHRQFFSFHGELHAAFGAAILQRLLREVRNGTHTDHRCINGSCENPTALLRALSLDDLLSVNIERGPQSSNTYMVTASFLVSGTTDTLTTDQLTVEAELDAETPPRSILRLGRATISRSAIIRD